MNENKFKLNAGKTHLLTEGTSARVNALVKTVEVEMGTINLKEDKERH